MSQMEWRKNVKVLYEKEKSDASKNVFANSLTVFVISMKFNQSVFI